MYGTWLKCLLSGVLCLFFGVQTATANRVALVVGIADYQYSPRLENPHRDALSIAAALKNSGFEVMAPIDGDLVSLLHTLDAFYRQIDGAEAAVFYFAGHGLQFDGINYIIPKDARLRSQTQLKQETIALQDIVASMEARARIVLVFLDACRDNPLADELQRSAKGNTRSAAISRGFAPMTIRNPDTLLVFAAAFGKTASDGTGTNSPFTSAILRNIEMPGVEIELMLKRVTRDVVQSTNGAQVPERLSRLTSDFVFRKDYSDFRPTGSARPLQRDECHSANPAISCLWSNN